MPTYIRLTDYKDSSSKEQGFFEAKNRYTAKQEDFFKIPGSPIAYWVSDKVKEIFKKSEKLGEIAEPRQGMATSDNDRFLRLWFETEFNKIGFNFESREKVKNSGLKWFPYNKGGEFQKWYGNQEYVVNWENDGVEIMEYAITLYKNATRTIKNIPYYFRESITYSFVSSSKFAVRYTPKGFLFDVGGSSTFPQKKDLLYITSFLNSNIAYDLLKIVAPTINFQVGDLKALPIIFPKSSTLKSKIDTLTQECINISKEDWDSRETSWDFCTNELVRIFNDECKMLNKQENNSKLNIQNLTLETIYNRFCNYWKEKFYKLHQNEEELNRLFIEIYGLEDELSPDVALEDITILKKETKIQDNKLIFQKDEIIKQLISYGVGVILGRYSLEKEGLFIANKNESKTHPLMDDDNIIPILQFDYFKDDIVTQFRNFLKVAFGKENLDKNIQFIESALNKSIRNYFLKDFYEDHIKRYKKRPIYWMVSSPKKGFFAIFYLHRYYPDIFARIQNSYLREFINKLQAQKESLHQLQIEAPSTKEKNRAIKELKTINTLEKELIEFDRNIFTKYAQTQTDIDLDDGVKENYCKFKEILYPIKGLCK